MTTDAAFWNKIAPKYAAQPVGDPDAFDRKTEITRGLLSPEDVVLEVGCGTGSLALRLCESVSRYHALDFSAEMLRIAQEKADAAGVTNISLHQGAVDPTFTALGPASVDGVLAFSILHLLDDRPAALAHLFSLVKPGGYFVASTVCLGESWVPYSAIIRVMHWFGKAPAVVRSIRKDELAAELHAAGFVDVDERDVGAAGNISFLVARKPA